MNTNGISAFTRAESFDCKELSPREHGLSLEVGQGQARSDEQQWANDLSPQQEVTLEPDMAMQARFMRSAGASEEYIAERCGTEFIINEAPTMNSPEAVSLERENSEPVQDIWSQYGDR